MNVKSVLLLSDNPQNSLQIQKYLHSWKIECCHCLDTNENEANVKLAIVDDTNCLMDGLKQIEAIRKKTTFPIIYISNKSRKTLLPYQTRLHFKYVESKTNYLYEIKPEIENIGMNIDKDTEIVMDLEKKIFFDKKRGCLCLDASQIHLTKSEQKVLCRLAKEKGMVVSRKDLMMILWQTDEYISEGTLTTCISRLRAKLMKAFDFDPILTKKGRGYSLTEDKGLYS